MTNRTEELNNKVKVWLFPSLVTVLAALIWRDVVELKTDVKALLAQSNIDKTRIDNIERQLFNKQTTSVFILEGSPKKDNNRDSLFYNQELAIIENKDKKRPTIYLKKAKNVI